MITSEHESELTSTVPPNPSLLKSMHHTQVQSRWSGALPGCAQQVLTVPVLQTPRRKEQFVREKHV